MTTQPDNIQGLVEVTQAIADAQFGGPFNGLEWPEAWDHFETLARAAIAAMPAQGWIVGNGSGDCWRAWEDGFSVWTEDRSKAARYARREDAEAVHREDDDAWTIQLYAAAAQD